MNLIKSSVEEWVQENSLQGAYKQIEKAARICYKSELGKNPAEFVDKLVSNGHMAMLEHGIIYLRIEYNHLAHNPELNQSVNKLLSSPYVKFRTLDINGRPTEWHITANMRVFYELNVLELLQYAVTPDDSYEKVKCFHFVLNRAIANEFVRHRKFSFAQESTRFCNYSKDKFDNQVTFVISDEVENSSSKDLFKRAIADAERHYLTALKDGLKPEEARDLLPLSTKTELIMTGFLSDWQHFIDLRSIGSTGRPHPEAKKLADQIKDVLYGSEKA